MWDFWLEREGKKMNLGTGEMPEDMERKQEVQDGRHVKSHETKHRSINGLG